MWQQSGVDACGLGRLQLLTLLPSVFLGACALCLDSWDLMEVCLLLESASLAGLDFV